MIYVVLGMHKSGTSLVTEMLHQSGIHMGDFADALTYDQSNKSERHETQNLNRDFLHGLLIPPLGYLVRRPFRSGLDPAGYRRNQDSLALIRTRALRRRVQETTPPEAWQTLVADLDYQHVDWGFKDPRTCLTYPVWERAMPPHKVIVVYRHYSQLVQRYRVKPWQITRLFRVLHGWTVYNQMIWQTVQTGRHPAVVISYERLMEGEDELKRLETFVGRSLVDVRRRDLYRNRTTRKSGLPVAGRWLKGLLPVDPDTLFEQLETAGLDTRQEGEEV